MIKVAMEKLEVRKSKIETLIRILLTSLLLMGIICIFNNCLDDPREGTSLESPLKLISPEEGAILDNGRTDGKDGIVWDFKWEAREYSGPAVYSYDLKVWQYGRSGSPIIIDVHIPGGKFHYHFESSDYILNEDRLNWTWYVVMHSRGIFEEWMSTSERRTFEVEPVNTDPPSK